MRIAIIYSEHSKKVFFKKRFDKILNTKQLRYFIYAKNISEKVSSYKADIILTDAKIIYKTNTDFILSLTKQNPKSIIITFHFTNYVITVLKNLLFNNYKSSPERDTITHSLSAYKTEFKEFTPREKEVMQLMLQSLSYQQIADRLFISRQTIITHLKHIYIKLRVKKMAEAVEKINRLKITG